MHILDTLRWLCTARTVSSAVRRDTKICALRNRTIRNKLHQLRKRSNKRRKIISIIAASVKRAVANSYAKMPRGSEFQYVAHNNIEDSRTDLLPSRERRYKRDGKNAIPLRNYPARTVIMRIVKRTPSFLRFRIVIRLSRRLQLPSTNIPTDEFYGRPSASSRLHRKIEPHGAIERKKIPRELAWFRYSSIMLLYNTFVITS